MLNILELWRKVKDTFHAVLKSCRKFNEYLTKNNSLGRMYHSQTFLHFFSHLSLSHWLLYYNSKESYDFLSFSLIFHNYVDGWKSFFITSPVVVK